MFFFKIGNYNVHWGLEGECAPTRQMLRANWCWSSVVTAASKRRQVTAIPPACHTVDVRRARKTRISVTAEGPRDALCQLKSCILLHNCDWLIELYEKYHLTKNLQSANDLPRLSTSLILLTNDRPVATRDFLLIFHCDYVSILCSFRDISSNFSNFLEVTWSQIHTITLTLSIDNF